MRKLKMLRDENTQNETICMALYKSVYYYYYYYYHYYKNASICRGNLSTREVFMSIMIVFVTNLGYNVPTNKNKQHNSVQLNKADPDLVAS